MQKILFTFLVVTAILAQVPHAYYTFDSFSRLQKGWKIAQSVIFSSIISLSIFGFVMIEKKEFAVLGAFIEIVINIYYYSLDFWKFGYGQRQLKIKSTQKWWRQNWIAVFFGILIPVMILKFSEILINL